MRLHRPPLAGPAAWAPAGLLARARGSRWLAVTASDTNVPAVGVRSGDPLPPIPCGVRGKDGKERPTERRPVDLCNLDSVEPVPGRDGAASHRECIANEQRGAATERDDQQHRARVHARPVSSPSIGSPRWRGARRAG